MNLFQTIKEYIGNYKLKIDYPKQDRKLNYTMLQSADNIGILTNDKDQENYGEVIKFQKKLISQHKNVALLTYSEKDVNFYGLPNKKILSEFASKDYDYLFDFTFTDSYTSRYIFAITPAHAKVTHSSTKNSAYADIIFDLKPENNSKAMIKSIEVYLNISDK